MRTILVGYDGSDAARRALARAHEFASNGDRITVVSVAQPMLELGLPNPEWVKEQHALLEEAKQLLGDPSVRTAEPVGDPVDGLVETAEHLGADLLVVGTHGRGTLGRLVLGSVSAGVLDRAPCDVLVVR